MIKRPSMLNYTHDRGEVYCQQYRAADLVREAATRLRLFRHLYDTIIIPPDVLDEVAEGQFATPLNGAKSDDSLTWGSRRNLWYGASDQDLVGSGGLQVA